jgi:hypothetical protein
MTYSAMELEPWVLVLDEERSASLALWKIDQHQQDALAIFSSRQSAEEYARENYSISWRPQQLLRTSLIRVLASCFENEIRYAALNPSAVSSRQVFVIRDVLKAARESLLSSRSEQDSA